MSFGFSLNYGCTRCDTTSFEGLFCTTPIGCSSPSTLTTPQLWGGGNRSKQGVVHHSDLVRLVRLRNNPNIKKQILNPHQTIHTELSNNPNINLKKKKKTYSQYFSNTHTKYLK